MDVSNSTGETTDYKVTVKGGNEPDLCWEGTLKPDQSASCRAYGRPVALEFYIGSKLIASESFDTEPSQVRLMPAQYWIKREVLAETTK